MSRAKSSTVTFSNHQVIGGVITIVLLAGSYTEFRHSFATENFDLRLSSINQALEKKEQKDEVRFKTIDSEVDDVDEKVEVVDDKVADVAAEVDASNAVADINSVNVKDDVVEVKSNVAKMGTDLTEASSEMDVLKSVLAATFPKKPALVNLADKRVSAELPASFFEEHPESAALTNPPIGVDASREGVNHNATKTIAEHCLATSTNIITCYQKYLDKLTD